MRSAYTILELIFVIVIIGILASIAIIKFNLTREDSIVVERLSNIKIATNEIISYAATKNQLSHNILNMSNALKLMVSENQADLENNRSIKVKIKNTYCIKLKVEEKDTTALVKIENINSQNNLCKTLQNKINILNYPIQIKGTIIAY